MPELPEVEICARQLRAWCVGRTIARASAKPGKPIRDIGATSLANSLQGRRVESVARVGKQLFVHLDAGLVLLVHLGMTGRFVRAESETTRSSRLTLTLDDGSHVAFLDTRRFGRVRLLTRDEARRHPEVARLGPDALETAARPGGLKSRLSQVNSPIKVALLDQRHVAGVGNIYASEALFGAKIHPARRASTLDGRAFTRLSIALLQAMQATLQETEVGYINAGDVENPFVVYAREGERCPRCDTPISRIVQGARSTFYCRKCQRLSGSRSRSRS